MRVDIVRDGDTFGFAVILSERNLRALLSKVQTDWSKAVITSGDVRLDGEKVEGMLIVVAENDEQHYADRPPPGPMHEATEADIAAQGQEESVPPAQRPEGA